MVENPNLGVLERFVSAVFAGDGNTIRSLCHPDFKLLEGSGLTFAGTYPGGDGFLSFLEIFGATFDIERLETVQLFQSNDPDHVIAEMELRATVRETGKVFETSLLERWQFRDGTVIEIKPHYFNAMP